MMGKIAGLVVFLACVVLAFAADTPARPIGDEVMFFDVFAQLGNVMVQRWACDEVIGPAPPEIRVEVWTRERGGPWLMYHTGIYPTGQSAHFRIRNPGSPVQVKVRTGGGDLDAPSCWSGVITLRPATMPSFDERDQ